MLEHDDPRAEAQLRALLDAARVPGLHTLLIHTKDDAPSDPRGLADRSQLKRVSLGFDRAGLERVRARHPGALGLLETFWAPAGFFAALQASAPSPNSSATPGARAGARLYCLSSRRKFERSSPARFAAAVMLPCDLRISPCR